MAPALTQASEPPSLAEATRHTSPPPPALAVPREGPECLSYKKLITFTSHLAESTCNSKLGPVLCKWAQDNSFLSPGNYTMEDVPPLSQSDGGHLDKPIERLQADLSCSPEVKANLCPPLATSSIMGYQATGSSTNQEIDFLRKNNSELVPQQQDSEADLSNPPPGYIEIMGKDIPVNDLIDTLTSMASNTDLSVLNAPVQATNVQSKSPSPNLEGERIDSNIHRLSLKQKRLERKQTFLLRRLKRITARGLGGAVSAQLNHLVRQGQQSLDLAKAKQKSDLDDAFSLDNLPTDSMKNMTTTDLVSLVRRAEAKQNQQRSEHESLRDPVVPALSKELCLEADLVAAEMRAAAKQHIHHDSDATESSSGGESCDEMDRTDLLTHPKSIRERALYQYLFNRGAIASRWNWLQSQLHEIDHKISTYKKHHDSLQSVKNKSLQENQQVFGDSGSSELLENVNDKNQGKPAVNGYHPANRLESPPTPSADSCARTRPFVTRRKHIFNPAEILQKDSSTNAFDVLNKYSDVTEQERRLCDCVPPVSCVLCAKVLRKTHNPRFRNLRYVKIQSMVDAQKSWDEKLSVVDERHHPVLSKGSGILQSEIYSCSLHSDSWRENMLACLRQPHTRDPSPQSDVEPHKKKKKEYKKRKRDDIQDRMNNSRRCNLSDADLEEELASWQSVPLRLSAKNSPCPSPAFDKMEKGKGKLDSEVRLSSRRHSTTRIKQRDNLASSYDINNIVIPFSMAAVSTVESLDYKEIITPAWREVDIEPLQMPSDLKDGHCEMEDLADSVFSARHAEPQQNERKRFFRKIDLKGLMKNPRPRRTDSSGTNTPDNPLSPRVYESSPVASPFMVGSEDSNHSSSTKSSLSNNQAGPSLSLGSLQQRSLDLIDESACEESELLERTKIGTFNSNVTNPLKAKTRKLPTADQNGAHEKSFRPINPVPCLSDTPETKISPFPSRIFPLDDSEACALEKEDEEVTLDSVVPSDRLTFSLKKFGLDSEEMDQNKDMKSGRTTPLSEMTDSAPDDDGYPSDDSTPPEWTISAIPNNRTGGCIMKVIHH